MEAEPTRSMADSYSYAGTTYAVRWGSGRALVSRACAGEGGNTSFVGRGEEARLHLGSRV